MGWDPSFILDLSGSTVQPKFILRFLNMPDFDGDTYQIYGGYSSSAKLSISASGPVLSGTSIIPGTWNVSMGGFTVPLVGDIKECFPMVRRGSLAELYAELNGITERIAFGQLKTIRGKHQNWVMDFSDIITAMGARADGSVGSSTLPTGNDPDHFTPFYFIGKTTTVSSNWHHSGSNFPDKLYVADIRPFEKETGEDGICKCKDSSGNEFYLAFSSAVPVGVAPAGYLQLTKVYTTSDVEYPSIKSPTNLSVGNVVTSAAILNGKPWDIFGKLLLSVNGASTNPFDKYPKSYSFGGFLAENVFDYGDASNQNYIVSSNSGTDYKWAYVVTSPWSSGIRTFLTAASNTGQWPVWRQNGISWRGCVDPESVYIVKHLITDNDIVSVSSIDIFDPNNKQVFYRSLNKYGKTSAGAELTTVLSSSSGSIGYLPAGSFNQRDNIYTYGYDPNTQQTERDHCADGDLSRLFPWDNRIWSKISLRVRLKYAQLCCGDIVELRSNYIDIFNDSNSVQNPTFRAMILAVDWNFIDSTCSLQLAILV